MRLNWLIVATLICWGGSTVFGQDDVKPKWWWNKQKKEAFVTKTEQEKIEQQRRERIEELKKENAENFIWANNSKAFCDEEAYTSMLNKIKPRINLNELEKCIETVTLPSGQKVDKAYFTAQDYFSIWDTYTINPYNKSLKQFKDTLALQLFDEAKATEAWSYPLDNVARVTSNYGFRNWRFHQGIDLKLQIGDPVRSVFDGVVRLARYNRGGYGYFVVVRHKNGLETLYGHLTKYTVKPGDVIKAGEMIGLGGNTGRSSGPHLHFEVRYQGYGFNPKDMFDFGEQEGHLAADFKLTPNNYRLLLSKHQSVYHRIRSGDSLWKISRRYRTSINQICRLNGISKSYPLRIGRKLRVR